MTSPEKSDGPVIPRGDSAGLSGRAAATSDEADWENVFLKSVFDYKS